MGPPSCGPRARLSLAITSAPTSTPASSAIRIAGATARAEAEAHHPGELDVTHAHATGIGKRRKQQKASGRGACDQPLGLAGRVQRDAYGERKHRTRSGDPVGDDAVLEVDQRGRHHDQNQHDAQRDSSCGAVGEHGADAERGGECLDERIADRDRGLQQRQWPRSNRNERIGMLS